MIIKVLGSAAGGGFPQWNCNCDNCHGVRHKTIEATPRTQSSIAISTDNESWVLFNASPDIHRQLESFTEIQPKKGKRGTGIASILLVDSQVDHTTGLLMLREGCPLPVYTTLMVQEDLETGFSIFPMLKSWNGGFDINTINVEERPFEIPKIDNLEFIAVPVEGKAPPYSPHRNEAHVGDNIAMYIRDKKTNKSVFYSPGLASISDKTLSYMQKSDCVLVDGTFWRDDEMSFSGVGTKKASDMGHLPQSGKGGMIEVLNGLGNDVRKVLIHINNTNPILVENSKERAILNDSEIEVAFDGMTIKLDKD